MLPDVGACSVSEARTYAQITYRERDTFWGISLHRYCIETSQEASYKPRYSRTTTPPVFRLRLAIARRFLDATVFFLFVVVLRFLALFTMLLSSCTNLRYPRKYTAA